MILTFPPLYPDELFYSAVARFFDRMGYSSTSYGLRKIAGKLARVNPLLPGNLDVFLNELPDDPHVTLDAIIKKHSLFPFFAPFLPLGKIDALYDGMRQKNGPPFTRNIDPYKKTGIFSGNYLKYCPVCFAENISEHTEPYWNRKHQIPGIDVCCQHKVFLVESTFSIRKEICLLETYPAKKVQILQDPIFLDLTKPSHTFLLILAREACWLLDHGNTFLGNAVFREKYRNAFTAKMTKGEIDSAVPEVSFLIRQYFSDEFLDLIGCSVGHKENKSNWVNILLKPSNQSTNPIYHLLMMIFLARNVKAFIDTSSAEHYGLQTWPCLNPTSSHFLEAVITRANFKTIKTGQGSFTVQGTFKCDCGFTYKRTVPDLSPQDRFRLDEVIRFGPIWEQKLARLWDEPEKSLLAISEEMGCSIDVIIKRVKTMRLNFDNIKKRLDGPTYSTGVCANASCADYGKFQEETTVPNIKTKGVSKTGFQIYLCKTCKRSFREPYGSIFPHNLVPEHHILTILAMLAKGTPLSTLVQITGYSSWKITQWVGEISSHQHLIWTILKDQFNVSVEQFEWLLSNNLKLEQ